MASVLTTERLILRPCLEGEAKLADEFTRAARPGDAFDPGAVLARGRGAGPAHTFLARDVQNNDRTLVITLKDTGLPIGQAGLRPRILPWQPYATAEVELHCTLEPGYWDAGYAEEACRALLRLAFGEMNLLRLVAIVEPDDQRTESLLTRLGFILAPAPDPWLPARIGVLVNPACHA